MGLFLLFITHLYDFFNIKIIKFLINQMGNKKIFFL